MFRLMSLNLNYFGSKYGSWMDRRNAISAIIQQEKPDVIALQAVRIDQREYQGFNQAAQLSVDNPEYRFAIFQPAVIYENNAAEGSAVLARIPIQATAFKPLSFKPGLDDTNRRILLYTRFDIGGEEIHLFNGHFSWNPEQAADNLREALDFAQSYPGPAILAGDFNNSPDSPVIQRIKSQGWTDAWEKLHPDEAGFTFESAEPRMRIDYIFVSQELVPTLREIRLAKQNGPVSDHLGLIAHLDIG